MNELLLEAEMILTVFLVLFPAMKGFSSQTLTRADPEAQTGQSAKPQGKRQGSTRQTEKFTAHSHGSGGTEIKSMDFGVSPVISTPRSASCLALTK